ncbi:MAG TPA: hypothetical protein VGB75_02910 [Jatrophihabitans sp.]|jgi:hypothetical protein|uniref:hypothetical protein n=1 Tax=Jatrophihabitans sp. TaxID=1932789 RepID=UPI002EE577C7
MTRDGESREHAEGLVRSFLDERLGLANEPPGLRQAVVEALKDRVEEVRKRGSGQLSQLRSASSTRMPDAYLHDEVVLEDELQRGAAGLRTAQALEGGRMRDPVRFEQVLARRLAPSAQWAMREEASRVPRPPTRPEGLWWSLSPIPWVEDDSKWPPPGAVAETKQLAGTNDEPVRVVEEPYAGWVQLGLLERQATLASTYPDVPTRRLLIVAGLEAPGSNPSDGSLPLAAARPLAWIAPHNRLDPDLDSRDAHTALAAGGPLAAVVDYNLELGAPHRQRGVGLHPFALTPRFEVVVLLGLRPERPALRHVLVDDDGPALVGRVWRGFLVHDGNYDPLVPGVHGADLILRSDLYDKLKAALGKERFDLRFGATLREGPDEDLNDESDV